MTWPERRVEWSLGAARLLLESGPGSPAGPPGTAGGGRGTGGLVTGGYGGGGGGGHVSCTRTANSESGPGRPGPTRNAT